MHKKLLHEEVKKWTSTMATLMSSFLISADHKIIVLQARPFIIPESNQQHMYKT